MKDWQRIREAIDACRPDSRDLDSAELQDVADAVHRNDRARHTYEQTQRADVTIRDAFRCVAVPTDLEQRLLARLGISAAIDQAAGSMPSDGADVTLTSTDVSRPVTRRRLWIGALATIAASILLIGAILVFTRPAPLTPTRLAAMAKTWTEQTIHEGESGWEPVTEELARTLPRPAQRWKRLSRDVVVFDYSSRQGRLYLFHFHPGQNAPLPQIPYMPLATSGKLRMGAWKEKEHIFIAVSDDQGRLDSFKNRIRAT